MDQRYEEQGISLLELWNRIWRNKILVVMITLGVLIVGFFGFSVYSRTKQVTTTTFNYQFTNIENHKYPDGTIYDYRSILSAENLNHVKSSDERFKDINVTAILRDRDTSVVYNKVVGTNNVDLLPYAYTIKIAYKHFNHDENIAEDFLEK